MVEKASKSDFASVEVQEQFPCRSRKDYNFYFEKFSWPVATIESAPSEFKRRLAAAAISYNLQITMNYALKHYMDGVEYKDKTNERLDLIIKSRFYSVTSRVEVLIDSFPKNADALPLGRFIAEWWTARIKFSIRILLECIDFGSLFEPSAITRALLEQVAWAHVAKDEVDEIKVFRIRGNNAISELKKVNPLVGRYYGWLSNHAHWVYDAHVKSFKHDGNTIGHQFASSQFKMISTLSAIVLTKIMCIFLLDLASSHFGLKEVNVNADALKAELRELEHCAASIVQLCSNDEDVKFLVTCLQDGST